MPSPLTAQSDEQLVAELHRLGVRHLIRYSDGRMDDGLPPAELMAALAHHPQARFRATLILLFLRHPEFGAGVRRAADRLDQAAALTLKLYYQAAVYLQRELEPELKPQLKNWQRLPDLFSQAYRLPPADTIRPGPQASAPALAALGELHERLSGWAYNWAGSYRHDIPRFLKHLKGDAPSDD